MDVNFISSKDTGEARTINILSDNEEIMLGYETDDIIINFFESFLNNYQKEEQIMRGASDFVFESVELLDYKLHKIKLQRGGSYIKSPKWIRDKSVTINPKNKGDSNCFQYAVSIALDRQDIGNYPQIISKIKPFIDKYNWRSRDFPSGPKDWKKCEQNNKTSAPNILYVSHNKKEIGVAYKSKYNRKHENQVELLMIIDGKKCHYLALKSIPTADGYSRSIEGLSRLLRGITSNHNGDFYCLGLFIYLLKLHLPLVHKNSFR